MKEISHDGYLSIGQVLKPQGLNGYVKIRPDTDDPGRFEQLTHVFIPDGAGQLQKVTLCDVSVRGGFVYLKLEDDNDLETAERRRGSRLYVDRGNAVPLGEHENFISDMIGCEIRGRGGELIGVLEDILQPGANDVYVVKTKIGNLLIPALRHVILSVDTQNRNIIADEGRLSEVSVLED